VLSEGVWFGALVRCGRGKWKGTATVKSKILVLIPNSEINLSTLFLYPQLLWTRHSRVSTILSLLASTDHHMSLGFPRKPDDSRAQRPVNRHPRELSSPRFRVTSSRAQLEVECRTCFLAQAEHCRTACADFRVCRVSDSGAEYGLCSCAVFVLVCTRDGESAWDL
jgi:hypothetical protein